MAFVNECQKDDCIYNINGDCIQSRIVIDFAGECEDMEEYCEDEENE